MLSNYPPGVTGNEPQIAGTCDCDADEMLPCEQHMTVLCVREGASLRTADELLHLWCLDATKVGAEVSPWGKALLTKAGELLESVRFLGVSWLPEDAEDVRDDLDTLRYQLEASLATLDLPVWTHWNDGYVMFVMTADCPLLEV